MGGGAGSDEGGDTLLALGGTALRVYIYLLYTGRPVGVRELQRAMGFKSPSTARHHLERLASMGLVERVAGGYRALRPSGILGEIILAARGLVPWSLFIAGLLLGGAVAYTLLPGPDPRALVVLWASAPLALWHSVRLYLSLKRLALPSKGQE